MRTGASLVVLWSLACGHRSAVPPQPPSIEPSRPPTGLRVRTEVAGPITGGTLLVAGDGALAVVSDPQRERIWVVDIATLSIRHEIQLGADQEPGRLVEDDGGRVHVVLRRGGAVLSIDPQRGEILSRRSVCPAPRGLAFDSRRNGLHVTCAGGLLVTLGALSGQTRRIQLEPDLRDVIVAGESLLVSRMRSAEILQVSPAGDVVERTTPEDFDLDAEIQARVAALVEVGASVESPSEAERPKRIFKPGVAWRMISDGHDGAWMSHQRAADFPLDLEVEEPVVALAYGGVRAVTREGCKPGLVHTTLTHLSPSGQSRTVSSQVPGVLNAIDIALSPSSQRLAYASPGHTELAVGVMGAHALHNRPCAQRAFIERPSSADPLMPFDPVAVAWVDDRRLLVQYRDPQQLSLYNASRGLIGALLLGNRALLGDEGHRIFHQATDNGIACASCHPEGDNDGRVWNFGRFGGLRRTQTLGGGVMAGAPFHWKGDLPDLAALIEDTFVARMGGRTLTDEELTSLGSFLDRIPPPPRAYVADEEAVSQGEAIFARLRCDSCHSGNRFTDNRLHDVGTGGRFKTAPLIGLAARAPYFHDGCAATLEERFDRCHTEGHGNIEDLTDQQENALTTYLYSL